MENKNKNAAELIYALAHDLRAPAADIKFCADALLSDEVDGKERYLKLISTHAERLLHTVEELLTLAAAEGAPLEIAPFAFGESARLALIGMGEEIDKKELDVAAEVADLTALGNKNGVMRVMVNLLENAVKYTPAGGSISLKVFAASDRARFTLANSALIPEKDRAHLFEPFYRGNTEERGTGLGLYSVKTALERMGTEIELYGEGETVFAFSLPLCEKN